MKGGVTMKSFFKVTDIKRMDTILSVIAKHGLGIETLETRKTDSLDFYDLSVWSIKDALKAAYENGYYDCERKMRK